MPRMRGPDDVGVVFVLNAIQEWGQSREDRIKAVQDVLDAAGFDAKATCWPAFGSLWPRPCEGLDGEAATTWLAELTSTMPRGEFNTEARHVTAAITEARYV